MKHLLTSVLFIETIFVVVVVIVKGGQRGQRGEPALTGGQVNKGNHQPPPFVQIVTDSHVNIELTSSSSSSDMELSRALTVCVLCVLVRAEVLERKHHTHLDQQHHHLVSSGNSASGTVKYLYKTKQNKKQLSVEAVSS